MSDPTTIVKQVEADVAAVQADTSGILATAKALAVKYGVTVAGVALGFVLGKIL